MMTEDMVKAYRKAFDMGQAAYKELGADCLASDYPEFVELCNTSHINAGRLLRAFNDGCDEAATEVMP